MSNTDIKDVMKVCTGRIQTALDKIGRKVRFMEVCGTHTMAIFESGVRSLFDEQVELLSGPGCPVCVTSGDYLDRAIVSGEKYNLTITTFGDMIRVPNSNGSSLEQRRARGLDVRVVYSPLDALNIAKQEPDKKVVFLAVGFETTIPTVGVAIKKAACDGIKNFSVLLAHKVIPPALVTILNSGTEVDGFLCPGHLSVITGTEIYEPAARDYGKVCVVAGFEPTDILISIAMLTEQMAEDRAEVEIQYKHAVTREGNRVARELITEIFSPIDANWRGIGVIPDSGLALRPKYEMYDATKLFPVDVPKPKPIAGCRCGEVLTGKITPLECGQFKKRCTPDNPIGPCMVSREGTCAAYFKYAR